MLRRGPNQYFRTQAFFHSKRTEEGLELASTPIAINRVEWISPDLRLIIGS